MPERLPRPRSGTSLPERRSHPRSNTGDISPKPRSMPTAAACQVREHLEASFPGFAACFDKLWDSACAWHLVRRFAAPQDLAAAGIARLCRSLDEAGVRYQCRTVQRVLEWAAAAAAPDLAAAQHRVIALALNDDRARKTQEILALERDIAARLVCTPYILLLSFPGI